jgi:hypothetical protein
MLVDHVHRQHSKAGLQKISGLAEFMLEAAGEYTATVGEHTVYEYSSEVCKPMHAAVVVACKQQGKQK